MLQKLCKGCKLELPIVEFSIHKDCKYGVKAYCKICEHKHYLQNKKTICARVNRYRERNKAKIKIYRSTHRKEIAHYNRKYQKARYHSDINFRLRLNLRARLNLVVKTKQKAGHTLELLGCSVEFLKQYLESQFKSGMSWENYGRGCQGVREWQIDHVKPCCKFDLSDLDQQKKCFHYSNLQPLWASENLIKRSVDRRTV